MVEQLYMTMQGMQDELRGMREDMREMRGEIHAMRRDMFTAAVGLCGALFAAVVTIVLALA